MNKYTHFIKKALEISELMFPEIKSQEKRLAIISGEKESTVKNWLFHDKIPVCSKRLNISDRFGVSEGTLFDSSQEESIPVAVYNSEMNCYLIPQIDESGLEMLSLAKTPLVITGRVPLNLPELLKDEISVPYMTYCLEVLHISFPPFITKNDLIFINHTASRKNNIFCIYKTRSNTQVVKVQYHDGVYTLYNKDGNEVREEKNAFIAPILLTLSRSY